MVVLFVFMLKNNNKNIKVKNSVDYYIQKENKFKIQSSITFKTFNKSYE